MEHHRSNARAATTVVMAMAISTLAVSAASATPASGSTAAQQGKGVTVVARPLTRNVHYDDLALATKDGRKVFMHRVRTAVSDVCPAYDEHDIALDVEYCSSLAWAGARPQIRRVLDLARSGQSLAMTIEITAAVAK
jgi:UrcA family protein